MSLRALKDMEPLLIRELKALADDFPVGDLGGKLNVVHRARENLEIMKGAKVDKETRQMAQLLLPFAIALEWTVETLENSAERLQHAEAEIKELKKRLSSKSA